MVDLFILGLIALLPLGLLCSVWLPLESAQSFWWSILCLSLTFVCWKLNDNLHYFFPTPWSQSVLVSGLRCLTRFFTFSFLPPQFLVTAAKWFTNWPLLLAASISSSTHLPNGHPQMPVVVGTSDTSKLHFDGVRQVHEFLKCQSITKVGKLRMMLHKQARRRRKPHLGIPKSREHL